MALVPCPTGGACGASQHKLGSAALKRCERVTYVTLRPALPPVTPGGPPIAAKRLLVFPDEKQFSTLPKSAIIPPEPEEIQTAVSWYTRGEREKYHKRIEKSVRDDLDWLASVRGNNYDSLSFFKRSRFRGIATSMSKKVGNSRTALDLIERVSGIGGCRVRFETDAFGNSRPQFYGPRDDVPSKY